MSEIKSSGIERVYRFIYLASLIVICLGLLCFIIGLCFPDNFESNLKIGNIAGYLILLAPFAPIGTLFGTLKERQSIRRKMIILLLTGLSVVFLSLFIWGILFAMTLD
jgi:hypothetical protein